MSGPGAGAPALAAETLPLTDAHLRFAVIAETTGRRVCVPLLFRMPSDALATGDLRFVLEAIVRSNPALGSRTELAGTTPGQRWHPVDCDVAEWHARSADAAARLVADAVDAFEESEQGETVSAGVIRHSDGDLLLLMFDHTVVDEQSLLLIKRQLADPARTVGDLTGRPVEWQRYEAAVRDRVVAEEKASQGPGTAFWQGRLRAVAGRLPRRSEPLVAATAVHLPEPLPIPGDLQGSIFPLVLASLHRALRDLDPAGPTVIGYTWGQRNDAFTDVVGCFMNTVLSIDTTGDWATVAAGLAEFRANWWQELDHADVPFSAVVAGGATLPDRPWTGHLDTVLLFEHAQAAPGWTVAGVPIDEIEPEYAVPNAPVAVAVVASGNELGLRLVADHNVSAHRVEALGNRFRFRLGEALTHSETGDL